jgi:hypothetical protein
VDYGHVLSPVIIVKNKLLPSPHALPERSHVCDGSIFNLSGVFTVITAATLGLISRYSKCRIRLVVYILIIM